jgi:hypothetical protein
MKKFTVSALCCVAACALGLGGCNKNADTSESCADKATCAEKSECSSTCAEKKAAGCCAEKAKAAQN